MNKICKQIFCVVPMLFLIGCINSANQTNKNEDELYENFKKGDLKSYNELKIIYLDYRPEDFISIAKYASDSLNYKEASLDVFQCYFDKYNFDYENVDKINLNVMKNEDKKEALTYLKIALKNNIQGAGHFKNLIQN